MSRELCVYSFVISIDLIVISALITKSEWGVKALHVV